MIICFFFYFPQFTYLGIDFSLYKRTVEKYFVEEQEL